MLNAISHSPLPASPGRLAEGTTAAQLDFAARSRSLQADVDLFTAEGDRVSFSFSSSRSSLSASLQAHAQDASGSSSLEASLEQRSLERSLSIEVEGDLSREERRELRKLFKSILKVAREFFSGDLDGAARKSERAVERLGRSDTLAGFTLDLSLEQTEVAGRVSSVQSQAAALPAGSPAPSSAPSTSTGPSALGAADPSPVPRPSGPEASDEGAAAPAVREGTPALRGEEGRDEESPDFSLARTAPVVASTVGLVRTLLERHPGLAPQVPAVVDGALESAAEESEQPAAGVDALRAQIREALFGGGATVQIATFASVSTRLSVLA